MVEVDRPDRQPAARGASPTRSTPTPPPAPRWPAPARWCPKAGDGIVEAIRTLRVTRRGAVKARTADDQPAQGAAGHRPGRDPRAAGRPDHGGADPGCASRCARPARWPTPAQAVRLVLRRLARRYQFLTTEIRLADAELRALVTAAAPGLLTRLGVGVEVTGQLLTTVGDNPDRMRSEAAFAHLCGVAPIPASSGKTRPPPAQPRRRPGGEQRPLHRRARPAAARRTHPRLRRPPHRRRPEQAGDHPLPASATSPASSTTPWSHSPRPRRPGRLIDCRGWVNPETPKARAAGLKQPLQSMTINARRGHHPVALDSDIGASWRSPTARRPGGSPRRNRRPASCSSAPGTACGSPRGGRRDATLRPSRRPARPARAYLAVGPMPPRMPKNGEGRQGSCAGCMLPRATIAR